MESRYRVTLSPLHRQRRLSSVSLVAWGDILRVEQWGHRLKELVGSSGSAKHEDEPLTQFDGIRWEVVRDWVLYNTRLSQVRNIEIGRGPTLMTCKSFSGPLIPRMESLWRS